MIQDIHMVSGGNGDDAWVAVKAVRLHQDLVDGLLALVISACKSGATLAADGIDLVDGDDAGGVLLGLGDDVTDARGADSNEPFKELGSGDGDEGDTWITGHGLGEKGLT